MVMGDPNDCILGCVEESTPQERICVAAAGCDGDAIAACFGAADACADVVCEAGEVCDPDLGGCTPVAMCLDDRFEDNDLLENATPVMPAQMEQGLQICGFDEDWYSIQTDADCTVFARIEFLDANGDLDLAIQDANGDFFQYSNGADDFEEVSLTAFETGPIYIQIYGFDGSVNSYDLSVMVACP
jgi:hypothetical protein